MADMRKAMRSILKNWGNDILLQRRINIEDSRVKEYTDILERWTVRSRFPGSPSSIAEEQDEGVLHNADMIYYFEWSANPKEGDRIYESYDRSAEDVRVFWISYALPMRGNGGRIEYWLVGAMREVVE